MSNLVLFEGKPRNRLELTGFASLNTRVGGQMKAHRRNEGLREGI